MSDPIYNAEDGWPRLIELMRRLRDPETGCPWDVEQTFASIAPYTIEEAYEVADAIEREAWGELKGELGDLLLQVIYHGQMAGEAGHFTTDDVAKHVTAKMIARHPHVFGNDSNQKTADQQTRDWETAKAAERAEKGEKRTLDGVALGLPA
ncbi:MAG: MazG family protein, partial [Pseudomonadota bacterium]